MTTPPCILAIETSCDETAVAVYRETLLAHNLFSQADIHQLYQGVVPEIAARNHLQRLVPLIKDCLAKANMKKEDITHIAYTMGPGLIAALMAGAVFACSFAYGLGIRALGIHHLEGHLLSPLLTKHPPSFPYIALLVSGGHTQLYAVYSYGDYKLYGESLDDAAGEAFDKVATLLNLPYPGGHHLEALALNGDEQAYPLTVPMAHSGDYNFSFSGLKTQVRYLVEKLPDEKHYADVAASFQKTIVDSLLSKSIRLAQELGMNRLALVGGVSANQYLRRQASQRAATLDIYYPPFEYCTDNAAMIAHTAAARIAAGHTNSLSIQARARCPIPAMYG